MKLLQIHYTSEVRQSFSRTEPRTRTFTTMIFLRYLSPFLLANYALAAGIQCYVMFNEDQGRRSVSRSADISEERVERIVRNMNRWSDGTFTASEPHSGWCRVKSIQPYPTSRGAAEALLQQMINLIEGNV